MELQRENENNEEVNNYTKLIYNFTRFKEKLNYYTEHTHEKINLFEFHIINSKPYIDNLRENDKKNVYKIIKSISFLIEAQLNIDKLYKGEEYYNVTKDMIDILHNNYSEIFNYNNNTIIL